MEDNVNHVPRKKMDANEQYIVDTEGYVLDPMLITNPISEAKKKLENEILFFPNFIKPSLIKFTLKQSYPFPKFIQWCVDNYSKTKRVIMNAIGLKDLLLGQCTNC